MNAFFLNFLLSMECLGAILVAVERYATICLNISILSPKYVVGIAFVTLYLAFNSSICWWTESYISYDGFFCGVPFHTRTTPTLFMGINCNIAIMQLTQLVAVSNFRLVKYYRNARKLRSSKNNDAAPSVTGTAHIINEDEFTARTDKHPIRWTWTNEQMVALKSFVVAAVIILGWVPLLVVVLVELATGVAVSRIAYFWAMIGLDVSSVLTPVSHFVLTPSYRAEISSWFR
jgi:hypothetical protein